MGRRQSKMKVGELKASKNMSYIYKHQVQGRELLHSSLGFITVLQACDIHLANI